MTSVRRRTVPVLAAAVLLLAGCKGEVEVPSEQVAGPTTAAPDGTTPPTAPGATPRPGPTTPGQPRPTAGGDEPAPGGGGGGGLDGSFGDGAPGSFARTLIGPGPAERILLAILVGDDAQAPLAGTLDALADELGQATGKPVERTAPIDAGPTPDAISAVEIRRLAEAKGRDHDGSTAVINALFVRGRFADGDGVLGVAVQGDAFAVFTDQVSATTSPFVSRPVLEEAVSVHELGHLLGLVDLARDTDRADPEHPGHSPNRRSVMYWAVESSLVGQVLGGPPPRDFDDADRADFAALRAGG